MKQPCSPGSPHKNLGRASKGSYGLRWNRKADSCYHVIPNLSCQCYNHWTTNARQPPVYTTSLPTIWWPSYCKRTKRMHNLCTVWPGRDKKMDSRGNQCWSCHIDRGAIIITCACLFVFCMFHTRLRSIDSLSSQTIAAIIIVKSSSYTHTQ